jgi:hypothetical protein
MRLNSSDRYPPLSENRVGATPTGNTVTHVTASMALSKFGQHFLSATGYWNFDGGRGYVTI